MQCWPCMSSTLQLARHRHTRRPSSAAHSACTRCAHDADAARATTHATHLPSGKQRGDQHASHAKCVPCHARKIHLFLSEGLLVHPGVQLVEPAQAAALAVAAAPQVVCYDSPVLRAVAVHQLKQAGVLLCRACAQWGGWRAKLDQTAHCALGAPQVRQAASGLCGWHYTCTWLLLV